MRSTCAAEMHWRSKSAEQDRRLRWRRPARRVVAESDLITHMRISSFSVQTTAPSSGATNVTAHQAHPNENHMGVRKCGLVYPTAWG